jgi:hypothetical protein
VQVLLETIHDHSSRYWERWEYFAWLVELLDSLEKCRGHGAGWSDRVTHRAVSHHCKETGTSMTEEAAIYFVHLF